MRTWANQYSRVGRIHTIYRSNVRPRGFVGRARLEVNRKDNAAIIGFPRGGRVLDHCEQRKSFSSVRIKVLVLHPSTVHQSHRLLNLLSLSL
jgi:hypothetical protein